MKRAKFLHLVPTVVKTPDEWEAWDREIAAERAEQDARQEAGRLSDRKQRLLSMGAPKRLLDLQSIRPTTAVVQLAHALARPNRGGLVVLSGGVGCGKTCASLWWLVGCRGRAWWSTASAFARANRYTEQPWQSASVAVLDDLGMEFLDSKGAFLTDLDELVSHYHAAGKRLVMTTNLGIDAFQSRYKDRISSRIRDLDGWLFIAGGDMRSTQPTESDQ